MTCLIPTDAATARATRQLSPLTIDVDIPLECSAAIASDASALTGSLTQTMPRGRDAPATRTTATVCPRSYSARTASSSAGVSSTPCSTTCFTFPTTTVVVSPPPPNSPPPPSSSR